MVQVEGGGSYGPEQQQQMDGHPTTSRQVHSNGHGGQLLCHAWQWCAMRPLALTCRGCPPAQRLRLRTRRCWPGPQPPARPTAQRPAGAAGRQNSGWSLAASAGGDGSAREPWAGTPQPQAATSPTCFQTALTPDAHLAGGLLRLEAVVGQQGFHDGAARSRRRRLRHRRRLGAPHIQQRVQALAGVVQAAVAQLQEGHGKSWVPGWHAGYALPPTGGLHAVLTTPVEQANPPRTSQLEPVSCQWLLLTPSATASAQPSWARDQGPAGAAVSSNRAAASATRPAHMSVFLWLQAEAQLVAGACCTGRRVPRAASQDYHAEARHAKCAPFAQHNRPATHACLRLPSPYEAASAAGVRLEDGWRREGSAPACKRGSKSGIEANRAMLQGLGQRAPGRNHCQLVPRSLRICSTGCRATIQPKPSSSAA